MPWGIASTAEIGFAVANGVEMTGGQLIAEYLVQQKVPHVFGICGHGNVGLLDELGTGFYRGNQGPGGERYNPGFAAWARAAGADGVTVTRSDDLRGAVERALRNRGPCGIDVRFDAEVRPPSTGAWQLPPTPFREPHSASRG